MIPGNYSSPWRFFALKKITVSPLRFPTPIALMWAIIGLVLTIGGTFLEAFVATAIPWPWGQTDVPLQSLGVTYQVGAVLLTGCVGGANGAILSQIAYVAMGLTVLPVFAQGGGWSYLGEPTFGYILGFIPGGGLCGYLAFRGQPRLEYLTFCALCGLACIHGVGMVYLGGLAFAQALAPLSLGDAIAAYSLYPLGGQLGLMCVVGLVAWAVRKVLFY